MSKWQQTLHTYSHLQLPMYMAWPMIDAYKNQIHWIFRSQFAQDHAIKWGYCAVLYLCRTLLPCPFYGSSFQKRCRESSKVSSSILIGIVLKLSRVIRLILESPFSSLSVCSWFAQEKKQQSYNCAQRLWHLVYLPVSSERLWIVSKTR